MSRKTMNIWKEIIFPQGKGWWIGIFDLNYSSISNSINNGLLKRCWWATWMLCGTKTLQIILKTLFGLQRTLPSSAAMAYGLPVTGQFTITRRFNFLPSKWNNFATWFTFIMEKFKERFQFKSKFPKFG